MTTPRERSTEGKLILLAVFALLCAGVGAAGGLAACHAHFWPLVERCLGHGALP